MIRNNFLAILLLVFYSSLNAQWFQQNSGTSMLLTSVHFINHQTGFICGTNTFLKTIDSGNTWQFNNFNGEHKSLTFDSQNTGWLCGRDGLFRSTDLGNNWQQISLSTPEPDLNFITFDQSGTGLILGMQNRNYITTNSGNTWQPLDIESGIDFFSAQVISTDKFYVSGSEGKFFISENSGQTWIDRSTGMPNPFFTIDFITPQTGWLLGCCGMYFKTTDAGVTWSPEHYITKGYTIYASRFLNQDTGFMVGDAGTIYRTTNSGDSWDSLMNQTGAGYHDIFFIDNNTGWAVGTFGVIVKTTNAGGQGFPINIKTVSAEIPNSFKLFQNYPNPFNPVTTINFEILTRGTYSAIVYDINGKVVEAILLKNLDTGKYQYRFSPKLLSSGMYFFKLEGDQNSDIIKMLHLK